MQMLTSFTEFSLNKWLSDAKFDNIPILDAFVVTQLVEEMGLRPYLKEPQCDRKTDLNVPLNSHGWNISNGV